MIARAKPLTPEQESRLLQEYRSGASVWQLHMRHHPVTRDQIVALIRDKGMMRPRSQKVDPSPEEIAERAAEIREKWSAAEAARRYVGRGCRHFQLNLVGEETW